MVYKKYLFPYLLALLLVVVNFSCSQQKAIKQPVATVTSVKVQYTCSMHPQIIRNEPGLCPICGMDLVKISVGAIKIKNIELEDLLKPANEFVVADIPVTVLRKSSQRTSIEALGNIQNDTRALTNISAIVSGRIEKMYIRYRYQMVMPGDRIMDIYSPEIATAEQDLLFILKKDALNTSLINAAKQKLILMGMSVHQLNELVNTKKAGLTITVYATAMGHVHEAGGETMSASGEMEISSTQTLPLAIREGMYVQQGQKIFLLTNPRKAWAVLNIFPENEPSIKIGNAVRIVPEAMPLKAFDAKISFLEPFYREGSKTLTARVYFDNSKIAIPIGSQVKAIIISPVAFADWLPQEAISSLGMSEIAFVKSGNGFVPKKIQVGIRQNGLVQIKSGLSVSDTVAANAGYLMDSESFIQVNNKQVSTN